MWYNKKKFFGRHKMQKTTHLTILEVALMILVSFMAGAIGGVFVHSVYKRLAHDPSYVTPKEQNVYTWFHSNR